MSFLKSLGVHHVFDTTFARDLALLERLVVWSYFCEKFVVHQLVMNITLLVAR